MPCYHPIIAYRSVAGRNANGKWPLVFNVKDGYIDMEVKVPCGRCIGCRLEYSRQWAIRCVHEAQLHKHNAFITLTYNDEYLPKDGSLKKKHFQDFMKRLRKELDKQDIKIRYYHCGEYGEQLMRPHYHAIIFGYNFPDRKLFTVRRGVRLYRSEMLERLWPFGFSTVGDVTFESAAYVARYVLKKMTGDIAEEHYNGKQPEYTTMSRRPGIGHDWLMKYKDDVYNYDYVVIRNNIKCRPPKYYDDIYDSLDPKKFEKIKIKRRKYVKDGEYNDIRLRAKEEIQKQRLKLLVRGIEKKEVY